MEIFSRKSNARKTLTKQKEIYTNRDSLEPFLECQFSLTSLKIAYFLHVFLLLYEILAILNLKIAIFKFKVKLIKTQEDTCLIDSRKFLRTRFNLSQ